MMKTGISTACLYPMETEKALDLLLRAGFRTFEFFLNTESELSDAYTERLSRMLSDYGAVLYSVHPFTSGFEPFLFFSDYPRRTEDSIGWYRRYFAATARMGARVFVFHGDHRNSPLPVEESCERFLRLSRAAKEEGVLLAQENVSRCVSAGTGYIRTMRSFLGDEAHFVLDTKQAVRAGVPLYEMLDAMGSNIAGVHLSDRDEAHDCLLPGRGLEDFRKLHKALHNIGYEGPLLTEVYRHNFGTTDELVESAALLRAIFAE